MSRKSAQNMSSNAEVTYSEGKVHPSDDGSQPRQHKFFPQSQSSVSSCHEFVINVQKVGGLREELGASLKDEEIAVVQEQVNQTKNGETSWLMHEYTSDILNIPMGSQKQKDDKNKEQIFKKRTKNKAKTTKPGSEWKSMKKTKSKHILGSFVIF
ncbi:hypothetical protein Tco_0497895 [Tanacetum coccineum]